MIELAPGQVWEDTDHTLNHGAEDIDFAYLLLSRDRENDGKYYWRVAEFMRYTFGATVRLFTDEEVHKFYYKGSIKELKHA